MKVLFLDIDGVLNDQRWYSQFWKDKNPRKDFTPSPFESPLDHLSDELCKNLQRVLDETGCEVVLSSDWRRYHLLVEVEKFLAAKGVRVKFLGKTDVLRKKPRKGFHVYRWMFIEDWLEEHPEVTQFAIVDDLEEAARKDWVEDHFVLTDHSYNWDVPGSPGGLREEQVQRLIEILK